MLLATLITQLADNGQAPSQRATEDGPSGAASGYAAGKAFFVIDDGTVVVRNGAKIVLVCRPGHVSRLVINLLRKKPTVSAQDLMDEFELRDSTAATALERLAEQGLITPQPFTLYRLRRERPYQLSNEFAEALAQRDDKGASSKAYVHSDSQTSLLDKPSL